MTPEVLCDKLTDVLLLYLTRHLPACVPKRDPNNTHITLRDGDLGILQLSVKDLRRGRELNVLCEYTGISYWRSRVNVTLHNGYVCLYDWDNLIQNIQLQIIKADLYACFDECGIADVFGPK